MAKTIHFFILSLFLAASCTQHDSSAVKRPPNIVMILADDLGYECLPCYGGESYQTPHLDKMARDGMKFTRCFSAPYCSPSRAQILTGRYPFLNGMKRVITKVHVHDDFLDPQKEITVAQQLQKKGYRTAIAGKWQLSFLNKQDTIQELGFDEYCCWQIFKDLKGQEKSTRFYEPYFKSNGELIDQKIKGRFGPEVMCSFLIDFMKRHQDRPFFVYYTSMLPHFPFVPTPDSKDQNIPTNKFGDVKFFADMMAYLDKNVGRLIGAVNDLGLEENTLILFTGDNGTDVKIKSQWRGQSVRGGKAKLSDRGTRVPLLVKWPAAIQAQSTCDDFVDFSDFFPTFCELASIDMPKSRLSGKSFLAQLKGQKSVSRDWAFSQCLEGWRIRGHLVSVDHKGLCRPVVDFGASRPSPIKIIDMSEEQKKEYYFLKGELQKMFQETSKQ